MSAKSIRLGCREYVKCPYASSNFLIDDNLKMFRFIFVYYKYIYDPVKLYNSFIIEGT